MVRKRTFGEIIFDVLIYGTMILLGLSCILPILNTLAISFSSRNAAMAGEVGLWPKDFNLLSYQYLTTRPAFFRALVVSVKRILFGVPYNMIMILITAYPLSKRPDQLKGRMIYAWYFVFTMIFSGGLIPTYMTVKAVGLMGSIWSLIIPGGVMVWNIILMMNFFRSVPPALEESAFVDGAGYLVALWKIYVPLSLPAMATIGLFVCVAHWNAWFDGLIYMQKTVDYPLQTYIYTVVTNAAALFESTHTTDPEMLRYIQNITDKTVKCAQIFLAALPILCIYPLLQKYFMKGLVIGSVKE